MTIADKDLAGLQIVAPRFHIRGRIVIAPGLEDGARGASVRLRRTGPGPSPASRDGLVGADGAFEFRDLLPGQYVIDVDVEQLRSGRSEPVLVSGNVDMEIVIPLRLVEVTIESGSRIPIPSIPGSGQVSKPFTGVTQIAVRREEAGRVAFFSAAKAIRPATPTSAGLYYFPFTRPAEFWLTIDDLPTGWYVKSMTEGLVDLTKEPLQVISDPNPPRIQITLTSIRPASAPAVFEVRGRVTNSPPETATPGRITIQRTPHLDTIVGYTNEAQVQSDGSFQFHGIPPGAYTLNLEMTPGMGPVTHSVNITHRDLTNIEISASVAVRLFALQACLGESAFRDGCFDLQRRVALEGVVKQFEVRNPRTRAVLTITDDKGAREVDLVGPAAAIAVNTGLANTKVGDRLKVVLYPRRDGGEGGMIVAFVDSDGKEVPMTNQAR